MKVDFVRNSLADWVRRRLGEPVMNTSILPPIQLDDAIDEAVMFFGEHADAIGNERQLVLIQTAGCDEHYQNGLYCNEYNQEDALENCHIPIHTNECTPATTGTSGTPGASGDPVPPVEENPAHKMNKFMVWKNEYQLPMSVIGIAGDLPTGGVNLGDADDQSVMRYGALAGAIPGGFGGHVGTGGLGGFGGAALFMGGWMPSYGSIGTVGTKGDVGRYGGLGIDMVSWEIALQYLEMFNQRYTTKMAVEFLDQQRKVRFSPGPQGPGTIVLPVWARVPDKYLYENLWVRKYTTALAKIQIGNNLKRYDGLTFPGGVKPDGDFYLSEGKEERDKLEQEMDDRYSMPTDFFMG